MLHACFFICMLCFVTVYSGEFVSESVLMFICIYGVWGVNLGNIFLKNIKQNSLKIGRI